MKINRHLPIISLILLALSTVAGRADRTTLDPTRTQIALPLSEPPTIDGTIDTGVWSRAGGFAGEWRVDADADLTDGVRGGEVDVGTAPADDGDLGFRIYAGYDSENLYVAVRVRDSSMQSDTAAADSANENTWEDDSVEVFVDGANANDPAWAAGQLGGQFVITANNAYRETEAGDGTIGATEYAGAQEITVTPASGLFHIPSGDDSIESTDLSYKAWVVHDADAIYVAVDVTDEKVVHDTASPADVEPVTWEDDSVEIFFDADQDRAEGATPEAGEGQYVFTSNGTPRSDPIGGPFHVFGTNDDWFAATSTVAGGYQVEFKVKKSALQNPPAGAALGFQIAVNDDDGTGTACCGGAGSAGEAHLGWTGGAHLEFTYGTLILSAGAIPPGKLTINTINVAGDKLELSITSPTPPVLHAVQQSSTLAALQWSPVPNVTFSTGPGAAVVATFPRPTSFPAFYRVVIP